MNILFCTSEYFPLLKTGGLADVASALPAAWAKEKQNVYVVLPAYSHVLKQVKTTKNMGTLPTPFASTSVEILLCTDFAPVNLVLVQAPIFENKKNPYIDDEGKDWEDNLEKFTLFSWVCASLSLPKNLLQTKFNVIVSNDWQTGLLQAYVKHFATQHKKYAIKGVHIIHNIAFPGIFSATHFRQLQLPTSFFHFDGLEYHGHISLQKAALFYADLVLTVSPNYAAEIKSTQEFGMGFEGLLQHQNKLHGILNGVDDTIWNPKIDSYISKNYSAETLDEKEENKRVLQKKVGLPPHNKKLLLGVVSRLTHQKGFDVFNNYITEYGLPQDIDFVILGTGDTAIVNEFQRISQQHSNFIFIENYDEALSHQIIAGVDALLIPSKFEPCGLTQLYAMAYGTVPLVHPIGGLKDSVMAFSENKTKATGFYLKGLNTASFAELLKEVQKVFQQKKQWKKLMLNGMKQDFSWKKTQKKYLHFFKVSTKN